MYTLNFISINEFESDQIVIMQFSIQALVVSGLRGFAFLRVSFTGK